jgi:hypothetical protein
MAQSEKEKRPRDDGLAGLKNGAGRVSHVRGSGGKTSLLTKPTNCEKQHGGHSKECSQRCFSNEVNAMLTPEEKLILESLIDASSLADVLETLSEVCREKSWHIAENWQDASLATRWNQAAKRVETCAASTAIKAISR